MHIALDTYRRAQFAFNDDFRRAQGRVLEALGLGPSECPYRIRTEGPFWRLREYAGQGTQRLLIIAAPIKRPYIWDLAPPVSAIRHCMQRGVQVWLLEWLPASETTGNNGIAEHVAAISECVAEISGGKSEARPFVGGHSLGGTLAAIYAATDPAAVRGLLLLSAPLCFQPETSRFRDALISLVPRGMSDTEPFPGSLLSHISALASPHAFVWSRWTDAALSLANGPSLELHARVERWALDEVPLPGKLVAQLIEWLYRENRFCQGNLTIAGKRIGPQDISVPALAVANTADDVASPASIMPFIDTLGSRDARIVQYPGEVGVCLQHLGILIGRDAHRQVWPKLFEWIDAHGRADLIGDVPPAKAIRPR